MPEPAPDVPMEVLLARQPELAAIAGELGLEHVVPADDGVVAVEVPVGTTYADVAAFERRASAQLAGQVIAISAAAAVTLARLEEA